MPQPRRPSPEAIARRRSGQRRLGILVAGVLLLIALVVSSTDHGHAKPSATHRQTIKKRPVAVKRDVQVDPLTTAQVETWIASRQGDVSAAVENLDSGHEWLLNPNARDQTASIVKADILETLMYQAEQAGQPLSSVETDTAQQMIEASDDDDATALWDQVNGATGISQYNTLAGLTQTTPNTQGLWGETLTSAADQIKILQQLAEPSKLLSSDAQAYQLDLMTNIDPGQNWGVTGGVPSGVTVALKNGWVNLTSYTDWEINSIGWVKGDDHDYLIAVLTAHDPSEQYGIDTIEKISADVYAALGTEGLKTGTKTSTKTGTSSTASTSGSSSTSANTGDSESSQ